MSEIETYLSAIRFTILAIAFLYFFRIRRQVPYSDKGINLIQVGFGALAVAGLANLLFLSPVFIDTFSPTFETRDIIRISYNSAYYVGILCVVIGLIRWSKAVILLNDQIRKRRTLQKELEENNKFLSLQARDLEVLTVEYIEQREVAIQAEKSKTDFLRNTSHELRTPLNAIIGFADILRGSPPVSDEEKKEYANYISVSGNRLLNLVNSIIEMAHIDTRNYVAKIEPLNILETLDPLVKHMRSIAKNRDITIKIKANGDTPIFAEFDENATRQAIMHVLDNAIKFSPAEDTIIVQISEQLKTDFVAISVTDNGPGIPPEQIKTVFDIFSKSGNALTQADENLGLGLTYFQKLAELQNGKAAVESDGKNGTTCILYLPKVRHTTNQAKPDAIETDDLKVSPET
ncbi:sensor histidine kinase [Sneathiella aquimaris]|uniref:sensor histidine kinase n=1 Tax=Sneathiella aquimaris TaxID=2599305 RepID=UPI00146C0F14|nr:HAMP domain-containing sensor histidine kinase [Sneathiella aquimaris]